jgi:hypothetical protein
VVKSVVGEENFIDMQPNRSNNFCCGGGGGFLQSGFKEQRLKYGSAQGRPDPGHRRRLLHRRLPQLPCPDPRTQRALRRRIRVVHLWTLICLSLGILGPNEREYLGDDLKEVNVFHPETAL